MTIQSDRPDQARRRDVRLTLAYLLVIPRFLGLVLFLPAGSWS
jgi:hypothetical protein